MNQIHLGDNQDVLRTIPDGSVDLIYIDPPFNTGRARTMESITVEPAGDEDGDRAGFGGRRYHTTVTRGPGYDDRFEDLPAFLRPRLEEAHRALADHGSLYFHIDYRESHYCKVMLDEIFGRSCFLNEIIWAYDYGGRPRRRWPPKHDTILFYAKDPETYYFDMDAVERIPYMAPGLVTAEKAARGKTPTDTWWHTIVPTNGRERTGYPTQKPLGILRRILSASSRKGDTVLDFFAGSGTTGAAALELGRRFVLVDNNPNALAVMSARFGGVGGIEWFGYQPASENDPSPASTGEIPDGSPPAPRSRVERAAHASGDVQHRLRFE